MNLQTGIEAVGIVIPNEYTEPKRVGTEVVDFDPDQYRTERELQNRQGTKTRAVKKTEQGFFVYSDSQDALSEHFLLNARNGVSSEEAVPALTVAVLNGEKYLIGGHHRAAGLVLAREKATKEDYQSLFSAEGIDLMEKLQKITIETWECTNEYELRILADRENCEAQHGERNTPQERRSMIEDILRDPYKRQYSDMAIAVKFLAYPKGRGIIQKIRSELVKKGTIDKVDKTIDVNGVPRKATRPGAHRIELLNEFTKKLETAMSTYVDSPDNANIMALGEAAGAWKDSWKITVQFLQESEKSEMTTWLANLYEGVDGVESPLADNSQAKEEVTAKPTATTETPEVVNNDDGSDDDDDNVDDTDDDNEAIMNEIRNEASGIGTDNIDDEDERPEEKLIDNLANAVAIIAELELPDKFIDKLEEIISELADELFNDENEDEEQ